MEAQLSQYNVRVIALSKDSVERAAFNKTRDGLSFPLLSDPALDVIRQFGLEHHKAVEFSTGAFTVFGIPLAMVPSFKTMAIPTLLLVDENGVIRWIDQAEDYRIRSDAARVMGAVKSAFA